MLSNEENGFLYDPLMTAKICLTGQLMLLKLIEMMQLRIGAQCFAANTDGCSFIVKKDKLEEYEKIKLEWQSWSKMTLEEAEYSKMVQRDINNFLWIPSTNFKPEYFDPFNPSLLTKEAKALDKVEKPKMKGFFEIHKDYHKNHSMKIVLIALGNYFIKGIPIEKTILECKDIRYFKKGVKKQSDHELEFRYSEKGELKVKTLGKITRYFVSKKGGELIKVMPPTEKETETEKHKKKVNKNQLNIFDFIEDDTIVRKNRESNVEAGYYVQIINNIKDSNYNTDNYDINYDYYFRECYKIINVIEGRAVDNLEFDVDLNTYYELF